MSKAIIEKLKPLLVKGVGVKQIRVIAEDAAIEPHIYKALVQLIEDDDTTCRMKASWALAKASEINPEFAAPFVDLFMRIIQTEKTGGVVREIYKTLACISIPESYEGLFIDTSFAMLHSVESDLAVKYHAKLILTKYVKKYPELKNEFIASLQSVADSHSDAWKVQILKSIAKLEKVK
ncbi:MAG: hypothetical protein ACKVOK_16325 [Flavobacteriales bacterium]